MPSLKTMAREAQKLPNGAAPKRFAKRNPTAGIFKSTERVAESDLESETECDSSSGSENEPANAVPPVAKVNGHEPSPQIKSSEDDSEKEDEEEEREREVMKATAGDAEKPEESDEAGAGTSDSREDRHRSGSSSESESESESDQELPQVQNIPVATGDKHSHPNNNLRAKEIPPRLIPVYSPPAGFEVISANNDSKKIVLDVFNPQTMSSNQQLWYITAPASVPIRTGLQVSLENVQLGKPALSLNGHDYGFIQESTEDKGNVMTIIPCENRGAYHIGVKAIDQTLHLQQIVQLPKLSTVIYSQISTSQSTTTVSAQVLSSAKRPVRKQPGGLKMRFRPIGFGSGKLGTIGLSSPSSCAASATNSDTDEVMEDVRPTFRRSLGLIQDQNDEGYPNQRVPSSEESSGRSLKRKRSEVNDTKRSKSSSTGSNINGTPSKAKKTKQSAVFKGEPISYKVNEPLKPLITLSRPLLAPALPIKNTPIPPLRTSRILPPPRLTSHSSDNARRPKQSPSRNAQNSELPNGPTTEAIVENRMKEGAEKDAEVNKRRKRDTNQVLNDLVEATDPGFSEKETRKEIRRLEKRQAKHLAPENGTQTKIVETSGILDDSPKLQDEQQPSSAPKPSPKPRLKKSATEDDSSRLPTSNKMVMSSETDPKKEKKKKKSKTYGKESTDLAAETGTFALSQGSLPMLLPPRKESAILPPKLRASISK